MNKQFVRANFIVLCCAVLCSQFSVADDRWMQIDKSGKITELPDAKKDPITWPDWRTEFDKQGRRVRIRKDADGDLKVDFDDPNYEDELDENRIKVQQGDNYGFVDSAGKLVIKPIYWNVQYFRGSLTEAKERKDGQWKIIDKNGLVKATLPKELGPDHGGIFSAVLNGRLLPVTKGEVNGLFDIPKQQFYPVEKDVTFEQPSEGLICFSLLNAPGGANNGYVNTEGKIVVPRQFSWAWRFSEGLAAVIRKHHWAYIDRTGKIAIQLPADCCRAGPFHEGLATVAVGGVAKPTVGGYVHDLDIRTGAKWGFINKKGIFVISPKYYVDPNVTDPDVPHFSDGLAHVALANETGHLYGFINKSGAWVIKPQFKNAAEFEGGRAKVCFGTTGFDRQIWDRPANTFVQREDQFRLFLMQYRLIKLTRLKVAELLGVPNQSHADADYYVLYESDAASNYLAVEIHYDNDTVSKYRYIHWDKPGNWIQNPAEDHQ